MADVSLDALVGLHILDAVDRENIKVPAYEGSTNFEDAEMFRFRLDGVVYIATEDPSDGYRSCLDTLIVSSDGKITNEFTSCRVLCRMTSSHKYGNKNDTLEMIDCVTGGTVLRVGTDNSDSYYPSFVAEFNPENMSSNAPGAP